MRPGILIKTLSHIWGRLNLPILLLRVGLLTLMKNNVSQAGISQASPVDGTLSLAESEFSQAGSFQSSLDDSSLSQSNISQAGSSQSSPEDSALQAESAVLPQAVRHSARLRTSHSSRQAGTTPRQDSMVFQTDDAVPQVASPQASASQEAGFFPNRHITPLGSFPLEEPNPK